MKDSFIIYKSWAEMMADMPSEELAELSRAIALYQLGRAYEIKSEMVRAVFSMIRSQFERDEEKYEETVRKRSAAGQASAESRKEQKTTSVNTCQQVSTDVDVSVSESVSDDKEREKREKRFTPPTLEEVRAYRSERGDKARDVDPETFIDFYASKGWKVGNQKMKDWKAAFRTWEKRDGPTARSGTKKNSFLNFPQREYDYDALERALVR